MPTDNASHQRKLIEVLKYCNTPRTIEDIAEFFELHPQTVRRFVWELQSHNRIEEAPQKSVRKKMWRATIRGESQEDVVICTDHAAMTMSELARDFNPEGVATGNVIAGCLSYLWRRAYYQTKSQDRVENVARQGTLDPYLQVRTFMELIYQKMATLTEVLEYMLKDMPELWNDDIAILKMMGTIHPAELDTTAEWFELWVSTRL